MELMSKCKALLKIDGIEIGAGNVYCTEDR